MLNNKIKTIFICLLFSVSVTLQAAGLIATVDNNKINFGESITVQLRLEDAKAIESIDISPFAKDFMIYNQQQFSSYRNVNGVARAESGWNVTLMPKKEGEFVIPSIALETDKGHFRSQEIKVTVQHSHPSGKTAAENIGISLKSIVSKNKTYVNEPIIYTLKIISYKPIANIVLDDIKSSDAIIEKIGDPKQSNQTLGGMNAHVIEIRYAVTALHAGKITINPAIMHGELQVLATQPRRTHHFGLFNDMFMGQAIELKPFSLQSDTVVIDAQPAAIKGKNWLPLHSLLLTEKFDGIQNAKVGETITRKIKMVAQGAFAKQLPSVKDYMESPQVKVYANKPVFFDEFGDASGTVVGTREEEYSIVPQQDGVITLPAVKITWYNLQTRKTEVTVLPEKIINVAAEIASTNSNVTIDYSNNAPIEQLQDASTSHETNNNKPAYIYILLGIISGILITLLFVSTLWASKKIIRWRTKKIKTKKQKLQDREITSVLNLRNCILQHAVQYWHAPKNIALNRLGDNLANNNYIYDMQLYLELSENINAALYGSADLELEMLISLWRSFKATVIKNKATNIPVAMSDDYASLNPT